jgi:Xaa-Pro aminopeptidase
MDNFARRRERLVSSLPSVELDAHLISSPVNVSYLTGFSGESSHLVLIRDRALLVSDPRFTEQLAEECPGLETHIRPPTKITLAAVAEVIVGLGLRRIGFESTALNVAEWEALKELLPAVQWKGATDRVERLRMVKDESEVKQIREAIDIAERAFTVLCALLRPDDSEIALCDALEGYVRRAGGRGTCFPSIIAVGPRAALPHAPPTERTVGEGELLLVDWGVSGRFYKSDLTRVLDTRRSGALAPAARGRLEEVHAVVDRARERAIRTVHPGVKAEEVDTAARAEIAEAGFGDYFGHGLGHGIGLQVHEGPALRPRSQTVLEPGMVFTIEPGVYLPGWGGVRIEDDVLVTPDGCEVLSHLPRALTRVFCGAL